MSADERRTGAATAADAYRSITAEIGAAHQAMRERDAERAKELRRRLAELDAQLRRVGDRTALTRFAVELQWEMAVDELWGERWMTLKPYPQPDPNADPANLDALDREVAQRLEILLALVRRRLLRR